MAAKRLTRKLTDVIAEVETQLKHITMSHKKNLMHGVLVQKLSVTNTLSVQ